MFLRWLLRFTLSGVLLVVLPTTESMSFTSPAPGARKTRTDQGQDYAGVTSIVAVAKGKIVQVYGNLQGFGQTIIEKITSGSQAGQEVYYGEETAGGSATVRAGQSVAAGQQVATGKGGVIEVGFWDPITGRSKGAPDFTGNNPTPAGRRFSNLIGGGVSLNVPNYVPKQYVGWVKSAASGTGLPASVVAAQIKVESGFDPSVTSPTGAKGIAQFEPSTWKIYGSGGSNNAYNASAALPAYVNYMSTLLKQYNGNIRNALAAYNAGPANISAGYGYADNILSAAGVPRTQTAGGGSAITTPITRPGGDTGKSGSTVDDVLKQYEQEVTLPRTAPQGFSSVSQAGWKAPFQWWWSSFNSQLQSEQQGP